MKALDLKWVKLIYPNKWKHYVSCLGYEEQFNLFICSKKYFDPKTNEYVVDIAPGTVFYDTKTGETLALPMKSKATLLIGRGDCSMYDGCVIISKCKTKDDQLLCQEADFGFKQNILKPSTKGKECELITFAKQYYPCISKYMYFPSPREIDDALKRTDCKIVCMVLYEYIEEYLKKKK